MMCKFAAARKHKPAKPMKKLNWVKVSQRLAGCSGTLWAPSVGGGLEAKVEVDPFQVEDLFSRVEVKKVTKEDGAGAKSKPTVVSKERAGWRNDQRERIKRDQ